MSVIDQQAHSLCEHGYYQEFIDHLVLYTGKVSDVIDQYVIDKVDHKNVIWGGLIKSLDGDNKHVYVLVSTVEPGGAFRKWRHNQKYCNNTYLEIVQMKILPSEVTSKDKEDIFEEMLSKVPKDLRMNTYSKLAGMHKRISKVKSLGYYAGGLIRLH